MNEFDVMNKRIISYSILLSLVVAVIGGFLFYDFFVFIGILIGTLTGLLGYGMIVHMTLSLGIDEKLSKKKGFVNYAIRYMLYAVIFFVSVYFGISVIALLVGFLCHKASIFIYVLVERKDEHARD